MNLKHIQFQNETLEKIIKAVKINLTNGCWEWQRPLSEGYGYLPFKSTRRNIRAHRLSYEIFKGSIPKGLTVDHLCCNRKCCNPDHLEVVTRGENARRGKGLEITHNKRRLRTHCKNGHEYTSENTRIDNSKGRNARVCRICAKLKTRQYRASKVRNYKV